MKPLEIVWTEFSVSCLDEIYPYLLEESYSETIASKFVRQLIASVDYLSYFPETGRIESLLKHTKQNSRFIVNGSYKIIYQATASSIIITDVFYTAQNPKKIVKRNRSKQTILFPYAAK